MAPSATNRDEVGERATRLAIAMRVVLANIALRRLERPLAPTAPDALRFDAKPAPGLRIDTDVQRVASARLRAQSCFGR